MSAYTWNAKDYERHSLSQLKWARELINKLSLEGNEDILDLGCGDGKITAEIARSVGNGSVIGVDNSVPMIELAAKCYPSNLHSNLSFTVADATNLRFEECFDVVFSNAALHWIKNHKPVVDGIFRSLKSGGRILLQMGGKGNARDILAVLSEIRTYPEWRQYLDGFGFPYGFLGTEDYEELLQNSGFNIRRVELIPKDMVHEDKSELEGWIRTTWLPYTERIPEEKRDRFIDAISTRYMENTPMTADGKVHVAMVRLEVEANKF